MSKQTNPTAPEKEQPRIEGNRCPATVEIEFAESQLQVIIRPEIFRHYGGSEGDDFHIKCELTQREFLVHVGNVAYSICAGGDVINGWLHPETVAAGEAFIKERLYTLAQWKRESAILGIMEAVQLEAIAERPISISPLKVEVR